MPKAKYSVKKNPQESDEFNSSSLGLQWQWQANYKQLFGMPMNNGWLRLYNTDMTAPTANLWTMSNLLLQKLPASTFTATDKLRIAAREE